ncbi:MAG: hypothetical protein P4M11_15470 [Candidatus Pacebacteria bacterium]|nr:hypothetical protein [Candidatus Paceibacterota bacterium]
MAVTAANVQTRADAQRLLSVGFNDIRTVSVANRIVQKPISKTEFIARVTQYFA